jgi:toxin ParE1/3/4
MTAVYTRTALAEIDDICSFIARDNPAAAMSIAAAIQRTIDSIERRPTAAPIVHGGKVRAKLVGKHQYRIFYEIQNQDVIIRNVRHTRRQRPWELQETSE